MIQAPVPRIPEHSGVQASPLPDRLAGLGRYRILGVLGKGAMGVAYHAWDPVLERGVALKVMATRGRPELNDRFVTEARAAARLHHANVVAVHDLGFDAHGAPYIVMELLRGHDLQHVLRRGPPLPLRARISVVEQVLLGLAEAHRASIVHRDVKPANVFVCEDGVAKLTDFGVASLAAGRVAAGVVLGTAGYMSPEQATGGAVDGRSDVFAAGCLLYELLTHRRAFPGETVVDALYAVTHLEPDLDLVPGGPEYGALLPLLARALAREPAARFQTADDFAAGLAAWRETFGAPARVGAERRRETRTAAALTVTVEGWTGTEPWAETTSTTDMSARGGCIRLARAVEPGRVLRLSLPLPRELRHYDLDAPEYTIWALVRSVHEGGVNVLFLGREPPVGFEQAPAGRYELPSDRLPATRRYLRFQLVVDVRLRKLEDGDSWATEWTVTEDVGAGGARVRTALPVARGEILELEEVGGPFATRCAVLHVERGDSADYRRLHVAFLDADAPERVRALLERHGVQLVPVPDPGPRERVLLVEADGARREHLGAMLAHARDPAYEIEWATSLAQACLRAASGRHGVAVATLELPEASGLEVLDRLRRAAPELPVLGVMPRRDDDAVIEALRRGVPDVVEHDELDADLLAHLLRTVVQRHRRHRKPLPLHAPTGPLSELSVDQLPALLRRLYVGRRTGLLTLAAGEDRRHVRFRDGHVVGASSSVKEERLGHVLVAHGLLSRSDLARATAVVIGEGRRLGAVLVELGVMGGDELDEAVALHTRAVLASVFHAEPTGWSFRDEEVPDGEDVTLRVSTAEIILDSVRRMDDARAVQRALGPRRRRLRPATDLLLRYQYVRLDATEGYVLSRIDGTLDVDAIAALVPIAPEKTDRIVLALLSAGLVEDVPPEAGDERSRPATDPGARPAEPLRRLHLLAVWNDLGRADHFEVLGVSPAASAADVAEAAGRLARRFHPDRQHDPALSDLHREIGDVFERVREAAGVLGDPGRRARYEAQRAAARIDGAPEAAGLEPPPDATRLLAEADRLLAAGRDFDAVHALEATVAQLRGHLALEARLRLARAYARSARWQHDAAALVEEVLHDHGDEVPALLGVARIEEEAGRAVRAAALYRRVLARMPDEVVAREGLARLGEALAREA